MAQHEEEAFPDKGHQTPAEDELRQQRLENERLRQESIFFRGPVYGAKEGRDQSKPVKIVVMIDNFKIHHSKLAIAAFERHKEGQDVFKLPVYAPELNLIERVWKYLRRKVTHTHLISTIEEFDSGS